MKDEIGAPIHEDADFGGLLREISAASNGAISPEFIEKDYWVTTTLGALAATGLDIWFKGGTALAKGYGAVHRFSEDLDLKILGSDKCPLPTVSSWKSQNPGAIQSRKIFFEAMTRQIAAAGLLVRQADDQDELFRSLNLECSYQGALRERLAAPFRPFILLEIGSARVTPHLPRKISSFVHDYLEKSGAIKSYVDDRPLIRCLHPLVTLIEKLDAISRHYVRDGEEFRPEKFVRHYDDAAAVAKYLQSKAGRSLPVPDGLTMPLESLNAKALAHEMLATRDIRKIPSPSDEAFLASNPDKKARLKKAHADIAPMYWASRSDFESACDGIIAWINESLS